MWMVFLRHYLAHFCLFNFFDDVSGVIQFCRFLVYADDLHIYHSSSVVHLQRCYDEVNADFKRIYYWVVSNGLKLNPKKSQVILSQRACGEVPQPELLIMFPS
jgi:hypothetical protein